MFCREFSTVSNTSNTEFRPLLLRVELSKLFGDNKNILINIKITGVYNLSDHVSSFFINKVLHFLEFYMR